MTRLRARVGASLTAPSPLWLALVTPSLIACVGHILPFTPKVRAYTPAAYDRAPAPTTPGSLYVEGDSWIADPRSHRVGDVVTVRIDEGESGTHKATTRLSRDSKIDAGIPALFGLADVLKKAIPGVDPGKLISASTGSSHKGDGETTRQGRVTATLPVQVRRVLPNGDLYIEGNKVVLVNSEEHHIYLSGVVRQLDLLSDNSVSTGRIADLQVELTGRGVVTSKQNPGWASRILDHVWPF